MCTIIPFKKKNKPSVAKEDIEVYKCGFEDLESDDVLITPYQHFFYIKDKLYKEKFTYDDHSSQAFDNKETDYQWSLKDGYTAVVYGFHALTNFDVKRFNSGTAYYNRFGRFIIPKGSNYFRNGAGCIVSEQIIFKEFITKDYHAKSITV